MSDRIRDLRVDADLRQLDVARALGITQRKYSYIETGTQQATDELLIKLALFYHTSIDYILRLTDSRTPYPRGRGQR
jgi:transcriptional regulator with XRE-family HTH domain